jgi:hypothetical protein
MPAAWLSLLAAGTFTATGCAGPPSGRPDSVAPADSARPSATTTATHVPSRAGPAASQVPGRGGWKPTGSGRTALNAKREFAAAVPVAARFFTAWASINTTHNGPDASLRHCAALVTPALRHHLAAGQAAPAGWQAMRAEHLVTVIHVQAVTLPAGAPAPAPGRIYLRVYAQQITTTATGPTVTSDGITLLLTRRHGPWLVARLLFY